MNIRSLISNYNPTPKQKAILDYMQRANPVFTDSELDRLMRSDKVDEYLEYKSWHSCVVFILIHDIMVQRDYYILKSLITDMQNGMSGTQQDAYCKTVMSFLTNALSVVVFSELLDNMLNNLVTIELLKATPYFDDDIAEASFIHHIELPLIRDQYTDQKDTIIDQVQRMLYEAVSSLSSITSYISVEEADVVMKKGIRTYEKLLMIC